MTLVLVDRLRAEHTAVARVVVFLGAIAAVLADAPKQHALVLARIFDSPFVDPAREMVRNGGDGTVAIGIRLSTAVFSVGKSMLVDALPYREAERATMVWVTNPRQAMIATSPRIRACLPGAHSPIEAFAGYAFRRAVVTGIGDPEQLLVVRPRQSSLASFRPSRSRDDCSPRPKNKPQSSCSATASGNENSAGTLARSVKSCDWIRSRTPSSVCCRSRFSSPHAIWTRGFHYNRAQRNEVAAPSGWRPSGDSSPVCHLHRRNKK